jgi:Fe-S oxidoreductase
MWPTLQEMLPPVNGDNVRVTYHDPCYLGRYNGGYDAPRRLLDGLTAERVEMDRHKQKSLCCGGGGGQMWLETAADERINHQRLSDALATDASTVVTACPYCMIMFDDAIRSKGLGHSIQVKDIAEMMVEKLENKSKQKAAVEE